MMNVAQLVDRIKTYAHDRSLSNDVVYDFINMTIQEVEHYGSFGWQAIRGEEVVVNAGSTVINTTYPVKEILYAGGYYSEKDFEWSNGQIALTSPAAEDTVITLDYLRKHPEFDGTELLIEDMWLVLYGAVYHALLFNEDNMASVYMDKFKQRLNEYYIENMFKLPHDYAKYAPNSWEGGAI